MNFLWWNLYYLEAKNFSEEKKDFEQFIDILPQKIENFSKKILEANEKIAQNTLTIQNEMKWISERQEFQDIALQTKNNISTLQNTLKVNNGF